MILLLKMKSQACFLLLRTVPIALLLRCGRLGRITLRRWVRLPLGLLPLRTAVAISRHRWFEAGTLLRFPVTDAAVPDARGGHGDKGDAAEFEHHFLLGSKHSSVVASRAKPTARSIIVGRNLIGASKNQGKTKEIHGSSR